MSMLDLFRGGGGRDAQARPGGVHDPKWQRSPSGRFRRLAYVDPSDEALARGGVYVLWHAGVKPEWMTAGVSDNLGDTFARLIDDPEVARYESRGGVFVTWSCVRSEYRDGVVRFLRRRMKPILDPEPPEDDDQGIEVLLPGAKPGG